jgi:hypothetical protein
VNGADNFFHFGEENYLHGHQTRTTFQMEALDLGQRPLTDGRGIGDTRLPVCYTDHDD